MTNYERIKNMSVEEMAQRILDGISSDPCDYCPHNDYKCSSVNALLLSWHLAEKL